MKYLDANNKLSGLFWSLIQSWDSGRNEGGWFDGVRKGEYNTLDVWLEVWTVGNGMGMDGLR